MAVLIGEQIGVVRAAPFGALMILAAAIVWAIGTVLLRKWQPPIPQNALSGWMMLLGWIPLALLAPLFDPQPLSTELANLSARGWFAFVYNIFLAGTLAHWAWFTLARTLPVAVSSLSSLPVPVVGVFSGIVLLGERPGPQEWIALALVVARAVHGAVPASDRRVERGAARAGRLIGACASAPDAAPLRPSSGISVSTDALGEPRVEVRLAEVAHRLARLARGAADVRQQHDVVHRQQRLRECSARRRTRRARRP